MNFNISDLLDDYQDASVQIQPHMAASTDRIKEITMKKIHTEKQDTPRSGRLRPVGRIALIAALILALATTVMAATGLHFIDWVSRNPEKSYDEDVINGSASRSWHIGDRVICLGAEYTSGTGLVICCEDLGPENVHEMYAGPDYWLEQWNGETYIPMGIEFSDSEREIPADETTYWNVSWDQELTDGFYRLGMTFRGGDAEEVCYVKFRIYQEEMGAEIRKCEDALTNLQNQDSYHVTLTYFNNESSSPKRYTYYTYQVWRSGGDYLREMQYIDDRTAPITVEKTYGDLLRDSTAYGLEWAEGHARSKVTQWEIHLYEAATDFSTWTWFFDPDSAATGEVYVDGDVTRIIKNTGCAGVSCIELTYTFDENGGLKRVVYAYLPTRDCAETEKEIRYVLDVHDTPAADCRAIIEGQDVSVPNTFSWDDDQAAYPDAKRSGFKNTASTPINSIEDAIAAAEKETTMTTDIEAGSRFYHTVIVSHDDAAGIWRVEFTFPQDENAWQAIYMDDRGVTQMIAG